MTTTSRIIIDGQMARIESISVVAETPLQTLAPFLTIPTSSVVPILPQGTVFFATHPSEGEGMVIVERQPLRTRLNIRMPYDNDGDTTGEIEAFNLQLPWQYFCYTFKNDISIVAGEPRITSFGIYDSSLWWRKDRYSNEDDVFWPAPVPNVGNDARICWGGTAGEEDSFPRHIDELTNSFLINEFNADLGLPTPDYGEEGYRDWERASEDPAVYLRWEFWERERVAAKSTKEIWASRWSNREMPRPINTSRSFIEIPQPPANFTLGRAREWIAGLPEGQRNRIIAAALAVRETPNE